MKKYLIIICIVSALASALIPSKGHALDYPHFGGNSIGCSSCHFIFGTQPDLMPPWTSHVQQDIDDTQYNALCWSCHNDIEAAFIRTHSSLQTDNGYGDWNIECRTCHNPHTQRQADAYGSAGFLYSGTSTNITATALTKSGAGWLTNQYRGLVVIPNTAQMKYKYKISGNTADTLMIASPMDLTKVAAGNTFGIIYGKLVESTINTPNSGSRAVKFFNNNGTNSFADGNTTYDGICEVCHTQTVYHRNSASGNHVHNSGAKCTVCHQHTEGFKGTGCDVCHGYPPVVNTAIGGPEGLVNNPGVTGSATAGAHDKHVKTKFYPCDYCHYSSVGSGPAHNNGDPQDVTIGFSLFGGIYNGGIYDGQAAAGYDSSEPNTTVIAPASGSKTCSNIYCHGELPDGTKWGNGVNTTPVWDAGVNCGDCHLATNANPPVIGSHKKHTGDTAPDLNLPCTLCHSGYEGKHADSQVNVTFASDARVSGGSYSGTTEMFDSYGQCSNIKCHSNVQNNTGTGGPTSYANPVWGSGELACTSCHGYPPATGSHLAHVNSSHHSLASFSQPTCNTCHAGSTHANGSIEVASNSDWVTNFFYNSAGTPGNGYGFCAGACHAGAIWNGPAIYCYDCHTGEIDKLINYPAPSAQTAPVIIPEPDVTSTTDVSVRLEWYPALSAAGPPSFTEYYVEVDDDPAYNSPNYSSGWMTSENWTVTVQTAASWHWRVRARDAVRTDSQLISEWVTDMFIVTSPGSPPAVSLVPEPDFDSGGGPRNITLQWNSVIDPEGDPVEYYVQVAFQNDFTAPAFISGWIPGTSYTFSTSCYGFYWRVRARDAVSGAVSPWSSVDYFYDIFDCSGE